MTSTRLKILAGAFGYTSIFCSSMVAYMKGITENGGSWADVDTLTIAMFAMIAIGGGMGALSALLKKVATDDLDFVELKSPVVVDTSEIKIDRIERALEKAERKAKAST